MQHRGRFECQQCSIHDRLRHCIRKKGEEKAAKRLLESLYPLLSHSFLLLFLFDFGFRKFFHFSEVFGKHLKHSALSFTHWYFLSTLLMCGHLCCGNVWKGWKGKGWHTSNSEFIAEGFTGLSRHLLLFTMSIFYGELSRLFIERKSAREFRAKRYASPASYAKKRTRWQSWENCVIFMVDLSTLCSPHEPSILLNETATTCFAFANTQIGRKCFFAVFIFWVMFVNYQFVRWKKQQ